MDLSAWILGGENLAVGSQGSGHVQLLRRASGLSVNTCSRHPSFQLSIAEDDDEWTAELGGQSSPGSQEYLDACEMPMGDVSASGYDADVAEKVEFANAPSEEPTSVSAQKRIGPADFHLLCVVGQGSFGKVYLSY